MRIATFNLENFDDKPIQTHSCPADRPHAPQLLRADADILCLQEVNSQDGHPLYTPSTPSSRYPIRDFNGVQPTQDGTRFPGERNLVISALSHKQQQADKERSCLRGL